MRIITFVVFFTVFLTCKNTNSSETPKNSENEVDSISLIDPLQPNAQTSSETNILQSTYYALVDKLRIRDTPGTKGRVLAQLPEGSSMTYLEEQSDFKDRIKLRGKWEEAQWLKVKTDEGIQGWVFGAAVATRLPEAYKSRTPYDQCEMEFVQNRNLDDYYNCIEKNGEAEFQKNQRYIKKHKNGYTVTLLSGDEVNLENALNPENAEDYRRYQFRYHLDKMGYFVFQLDGHEKRDFILMDDKYGYVNMLYGFPRMSPDRRNMFILSFDSVDGEGTYAMKVLNKGDNGLKTVYEEEISKFKPANPRWLDDKNIELDFLSPAQEKNQWRVKAKLSEISSANWQLSIGNRRTE